VDRRARRSGGGWGDIVLRVMYAVEEGCEQGEWRSGYGAAEGWSVDLYTAAA